jgi:hypothetical protein
MGEGASDAGCSDRPRGVYESPPPPPAEEGRELLAVTAAVRPMLAARPISVDEGGLAQAAGGRVSTAPVQSHRAHHEHC